jgi:hypothetical protein
MRAISSCSWCGELADVSPAASPTCYHCGHRPDLPRYRCDCRACAARVKLYEPEEVVEGNLFAVLNRRPVGENGGSRAG